jgi:hypothetical protein
MRGTYSLTFNFAVEIPDGADADDCTKLDLIDRIMADGAIDLMGRRGITSDCYTTSEFCPDDMQPAPVMSTPEDPNG